MDTELLDSLLKALEAPQMRYQHLESYYQGTQPNGFLNKEQRDALGDRLTHLSVNIPRLAVSSISQRLYVQGFTGVDISEDWYRNDLDQLQDVIHREALALSVSYAIVWSDPQGRPKVTAESAREMCVIRDPGSGVITSALKRWETEKTTEATVFTPDAVYKLRADRTGATGANSFYVYETLDNPLGVVPVVQFRNLDRFTPHSEIFDLADLVDGLNLALADLAVAQAFNARPKAWSTGISLEERQTLDSEGNPVLDSEGNAVVELVNPVEPRPGSSLVSENDAAKFGQLEGSSLSGFEAAVRIWLSAIQAVTSLPASALGILSDQPNSEGSLRAASSQLESKAQNRGAVFGRQWEGLARLVVAVRDGVDPADVAVRVKWRDFGVDSFGAEADGVTKLYQAGLISRTGALSRLGYSQDEIDAERVNRRQEALDGQGVRLPRANRSDAPTGQLEAA